MSELHITPEKTLLVNEQSEEQLQPTNIYIFVDFGHGYVKIPLTEMIATYKEYLAA